MYETHLLLSSKIQNPVAVVYRLESAGQSQRDSLETQLQNPSHSPSPLLHLNLAVLSEFRYVGVSCFDDVNDFACVSEPSSAIEALI